MGFHTPNIDRIAKEGMMFIDYYGEQSFIAGRASFITGQHGLRTGMTKVGMPGATTGLRYDNWKLVFLEQQVQGTLLIWANPFTHLRGPKMYNVRTDPFERADITSN